MLIVAMRADRHIHGYNYTVPGERVDAGYVGTLMGAYLPLMRLLGYGGSAEDVHSAPAKLQKIAKFWLAIQGNYYFGTVIGRGKNAAGQEAVAVTGLQDHFAWLVSYGSTDTVLRAFKDIGVTLAVRTHGKKTAAAALNWETELPAHAESGRLLAQGRGGTRNAGGRVSHRGPARLASGQELGPASHLAG
jgi:hypothetical protein